MDYEKNKEALAIVKQMVADGQVAQDVAEKYFPELKESEDERIINRIKKAVEEYWSDEPLDEILAWLEKQGDKKEDMIQNACEAFCQVRCKGNPPRSTCTSLGTCMEHDDFCKAIK